MRDFLGYMILFFIGASGYYFLEVVWRGYSHISMFFLGGLCFSLVGFISQYYSNNGTNIIVQLLIYSGLITLLEFIFGWVLNIKFGLGVWDYKDLNYNLMGQVSLQYSILWFFLSLPIILFYKYLSTLLLGK